MKKRIIAFLLLCCMVISLAGCSKQSNEQASNTEKPTATAAPTAAATDAAAATEAPTKADEVVTIDVYISCDGATGLQNGNKWWVKYLAEEIGVQVNLINAYRVDLATYLAGGNLPDLIVFNDQQAELFENAYEAGYLVNLDERKDQIPNVFANLTEYALDVQRDYTDGVLYSLPTESSEYRTSVGRVEYRMCLLKDPYEAYLAANGKPELKTIFDFIPVLQWMQENHPTDKMGRKTFGMSFFTDWDGNTNQLIDKLCQMEGYLSMACFPAVVYADDMSTQYIFDDDGIYKRMIQFMFEVNQAGLLDADTLTQSWDTLQNKITGGRVLSGVTWYDPTPYHVVVDYEDFHPIDVYGPWRAGNFAGVQHVAVAANGEHVDKVLALLNMAADPDAVWYCMYGNQGEWWDLNENGEPYITELGVKMGKDKRLQFADGGNPQDESFLGETFRLLSPHTPHPVYGIGNDWRYFKTVAPLDQESEELIAFYEEYYGIDMQGIYRGETQVVEALGKFATYRLEFSDVTQSDEVKDILTRSAPICSKAVWNMIYAKDQAEFDRLWKELQEDMEYLGMRDVYDYEVQRLNDGTLRYN